MVKQIITLLVVFYLGMVYNKNINTKCEVVFQKADKTETVLIGVIR